MRALVLTVLALAAAGGISHAGGECSVPTDCEVFGARCENQRCTIHSATELFPTLPLNEIRVNEPPELARTSNQPAFSWQPSTDADLVTVVVFRNPPRYGSPPDKIANFGDAVWAWHSNLPGAGISTSSIAYQEGHDVTIVESGDPIDAHELRPGPPTPLGIGTYYWGVWGWNGVELTDRSELRSFVVVADDVTGRVCGRRCDPTDCVLPSAEPVNEFETPARISLVS
jgi:hypothetical protein